ncbi:MAG TPA: ATP-binding protein, partial [Verrucomicrobiae bacterium]|nr:ATP-binding protein [Verrucomicrobiae bacterium]
EMSVQLVPAIRRALEKSEEARQKESSRQNELQALLEQSEQRCRQRTAELDAALRELDAFSYSVSHDLRAPLRHIDGFVEMLQQRLGQSLDASSKEYLGIISAAAKQMGTLIDALLSFSRSSRAPIFNSQVALDKLVQSVVRDLRFEWEGRQVEWIIESLPTVEGDPTLLRQVLLNLIGNALKFSRKREKPRIEVSASDQGSEWMIQVRDNGAGFDMQYAGKLFGVFQRLHPATDFEGIGIGLANVRRIVQRHGGRTWAEGSPGAGATFYFSLPRAGSDDRPGSARLGGTGHRLSE